MSEGAYDPNYDGPKKISRRRLLGQAAAVLVTGTAIGAGVGIPLALRKEDQPETSKTTLELLLEKGIEPKEIYTGDIKISKGNRGIMLSVRSETNNLSGARVTDWVNIETWDGVNVRYVDEFTIKKCLLVEGQYMDDATGNKGEKGLWIVGNVGTDVLGAKSEGPKFISKSSSTGSHVEFMGGELEKIVRFDKTGVVTDKQRIPANQIGLVTPLPKAA